MDKQERKTGFGKHDVFSAKSHWKGTVNKKHSKGTLSKMSLLGKTAGFHTAAQKFLKK